MSKLLTVDMDKYDRIGDLFTQISKDRRRCRGKGLVESCRSEPPPPPLKTPGSATPRSGHKALHFLVDENFDHRLLPPISQAQHPLSFVKNIMAGAPDESVFAFAIDKGFTVLTHDRGFADYERHNHSHSHGVIIVPQIGGKGSSAKLVEAALSHCLSNFGSSLTHPLGVVVSYDREGNFKALRPSKDAPQKPELFMEGHCPPT